MISFFKEIFEYHHHFNQKLSEEVEKHIGDLPNRSHPLFCHILNAHEIWNARIMGENAVSVNDLHGFEKCRMMDTLNFKKTLNILENNDLNKIISYKNSKGEPFSNSIRNILFHVSNHSTHHKGQIISDFRQKGINPIVTDYLFYKRK